MRRPLTVALGTSLLALLLVSAAAAGQNAAATARLYWLSGTTATSGTGSTNSTSSTAIVLVTCKGVSNFRGADVQLRIGLLQTTCFSSPCQDENWMDWGYLPLPEAWQTGLSTGKAGGWNGGAAATWPNVLTASPSVPGPITVKDGSYVMYHFGGGLEGWTPYHEGLVWFSIGGTQGVARDPNKEYAVFGFTLQLNSGLRGDNVDPAGPLPVNVQPIWHGFSGGDRQNTMQLLDSLVVADYVLFEAGYQKLTWHGEIQLPVVPVKPTTWGAVRKMYR